MNLNHTVCKFQFLFIIPLTPLIYTRMQGEPQIDPYININIFEYAGIPSDLGYC